MRRWASANFSSLHFKGFDRIVELEIFLGGQTRGTESFEYRNPHLKIKRFKVHILNEFLDNYRIWLEYETEKNEEFCEKYLAGKDSPGEYLQTLIYKYLNLHPIKSNHLYISDFDFFHAANLSGDLTQWQCLEKLRNMYKTEFIRNLSNINGIGKKSIKIYTKVFDYFKKNFKNYP